MAIDPAGDVPDTSSEAGPTKPGETGALAALAMPTLPTPAIVERRSSDPALRRRIIRLLDWFLVAAILLLAFLLGSFLARNTDVWMHLAAGRSLFRGTYRFGVDPFSSTMTDVYWVNHAWLFDLAAYSVYQTFGGAGLVILKALVLILLAALLIRLGHREGSVWISVVFTALAALAMSARMGLQPVCLSYLFLGLTLWFLERPERSGIRDVKCNQRVILAAFRKYWPLLLLFAFWVNLDEWFILGPITVGLYALGQTMQDLLPHSEALPRRGNAKQLLVVFAAGVAVCLLNPHHIYAFVAPTQLGWSATAELLRQDPSIQILFASPFDSTYFHTLIVAQVSGWAYVALVILGLFSFTINRSIINPRRMVIWAAFFALSAYQARTIPFFAIVAGPIAALNLQDYLLCKYGHAPIGIAPAPIGSLYGRWFTAVVLLALLILAWPGWLQPHPCERRAWAVAVDPSLERAAAQMKAWRKDGRLGHDALGLNLLPDSANYFAWACPEEKGFVDSRLRMSADAAADFLTVRQALFASPNQIDGSNGLGETRNKDWRDLLRSRHINHLILHDSDLRRISIPLRRLLAYPEEWSLLYLDGRTAVFGWQDPAVPERDNVLAGLQVDFIRRGFHPSASEQAPHESPRREAKPWQWWDAFFQPPEFRSLDTDEAAACLIAFEAEAPRLMQAKHKRWENSLAASALGLTAAQGFTAPNLALMLRLSTAGSVFDERATPRKEALRPGEVDLAAMVVWNNVFAQADDEALALPLVAARAARRALAANPADVDAHQWLGQAYLTLRDLAGDSVRAEVSTPVSMVRHVQIVSVLEEAVRLNPDLEAVHHALAKVYSERRYLDMALEHRRAEQRVVVRAGPRPRESAEEFTQRADQLEKLVRDLEEAVQNRQNELVVRSPSMIDDPLARAQLALGLGLAKQALDDVLLKSDVLLFGGAGARLEITLCLMLGRANDARARLEDPDVQESKSRLGIFEMLMVDPVGRSHIYRLPAHEWLTVCQAAATGDYDRASDALDTIQEQLRAEKAQSLPLIHRELALAIASEIAFRRDAPACVACFAMRNRREQLTRLMVQSELLEDEQVDLHVLSGLLALEQGSAETARQHLEQAIACVDDERRPGVNFGGRTLALNLLKRVRAMSDALMAGP
jgi:tetratricopeptide (TPR) repeat protein